MITKDEYLNAVKILKKYRKQQMKSAVKAIDSDNLLSEYLIPRRIQKKLGEIYLWNSDDHIFRNNDWLSCFKMMRISDLKTPTFEIRMLRNWRGIGTEMIKDIAKIYKDIGID